MHPVKYIPCCMQRLSTTNTEYREADFGYYYEDEVAD